MTSKVGQPHKLASGDILAVIAKLGGEASWSTLRTEFPDVSSATLARRVDELISAETLLREARGLYATPDAERRLPPLGLQIVGALEAGGVEGHLTGFDLLGPYAHQFVFAYPHIVCVEPSSYDGAETALADAGFVVVAAGPSATGTTAETSRLVILRPQPDAERRFGVQRHVAPVEKAWVDLLRETRRSRLPFQFLELGRLLRNVDDRKGGNRRRLASYAKRVGYGDWVQAARTNSREVEDPDMRALVVGYWTP